MRSSTWNRCTSAHGTFSSARARSMSHGVWPPLTASAKHPRAPTAVRASPAMNAAARLATVTSSPSTSVFIAALPLRCHGRVLPAARGVNVLIDLPRPPGARLVFVDRRALLQDRVDDAPRLFDVILSCEQRAIAGHGVAEHALVGIHLFRAGAVTRQQLHLLTDLLVFHVHHRRAEGDGYLGADAEPEMVRRSGTRGEDPRRAAQANGNLRARHGQRLSGPDEKRHPLPAPGIDLQPQCREGLDLRIRRDAWLFPVAAELAADHIFRIDRRNGLQDLDLFITHGFAVGSCRRLHRKVRQYLKQVILDDVANGARLVIEGAAAL